MLNSLAFPGHRSAHYGMGCDHATASVLWVIVEQSEWAAALSKAIAREVRRHRQARGMSAQQLADACAELGMSALQRTVISNIENGRRANLTVAEVAVLAEALGVPPAALMFPAGHVEEVEVLPGKTVTPLEAADWWYGADAAEDSDLSLMRIHRDLERRIRGLYRGIWEQAIADYRWHSEPDGPEAQAARALAQELTDQLHTLREEIASRGLVLPPLEGLDGYGPGEG